MYTNEQTTHLIFTFTNIFFYKKNERITNTDIGITISYADRWFPRNQKSGLEKNPAIQSASFVRFDYGLYIREDTPLHYGELRQIIVTILQSNLHLNCLITLIDALLHIYLSNLKV